MVAALTLFVFGFVILIKGADVLVRESSSLARYLGVSGFVIGVLVAGVGTSIPEFAVTFTANLVDENDVGLGTIIGSNTFNLLFILGLCALFFPLYLKREWVTRDLVWNVVAILATVAAAIGGIITQTEGAIMAALCVLWIVLVSRQTRGNHVQGATTSVLFISFLLAVAGIAGVLVGSYFVVNGAVEIARDLGVSEVLVGLLIVGIGTSLPEIAVSLTAAAKRQYGIAVGNVIGSNVFDFLGIIGITALVRPITFEDTLFTDLMVTAWAATVVIILASSNKEHRIGRLHGALLLVLFAIYLVFVLVRN